MINKQGDSYREYFTSQYMDGANEIRLLEELLVKYPIDPGARILEIGCHKGLTSLYLVRETDAQVISLDTGSGAKENADRFDAWGISDKATLLCTDSERMPFVQEYFDVVISIDFYQYAGRNHTFFESKVLPMLKPGGMALFAIMGLRKELTDGIPVEMVDWLGREYDYFHNRRWWRENIGCHEAIEALTIWEMENEQIAWEEWFACGHPYGTKDQEAFRCGMDSLICYLGIAVKKEGSAG